MFDRFMPARVGAVLRIGAVLLAIQCSVAMALPSFSLSSTFDLSTVVPVGGQFESVRINSSGAPVYLAAPIVAGLSVNDVNSSSVAAGTCLGNGFGASFGACTFSASTGIAPVPFSIPAAIPGQAFATDAYDINDHGDVLGGPTSVNNGNTNIALQVLMANGSLVDLGFSSYRRPVFNSALEVITGSLQNEVMYHQGTVQASLGSMVTDLNGFHLLQATDINDAGYVVGFGTDATGQWRGFVLSRTSVPEPATLPLALLGLAVPAGLRRRRAKSPLPAGPTHR